MERIKFDPNERTDAEQKALAAAKRHRLLEKQKRKRVANKVKEQPPAKGLGDEIWHLCYLYRLRDIISKRFGWRDWMSTLPPLERSGCRKDDEGIYRPDENIRFKA